MAIRYGMSVAIDGISTIIGVTDTEARHISLIIAEATTIVMSARGYYYDVSESVMDRIDDSSMGNPRWSVVDPTGAVSIIVMLLSSTIQD